MTKINPHWSFWVVAVVALLWFGFGVLSFLQISFSEFTDSSGAERSYFEYMSMWTPPVTELFVEQLRLTSNMVIRDGVIDPGTDKYSVG